MTGAVKRVFLPLRKCESGEGYQDLNAEGKQRGIYAHQGTLKLGSEQEKWKWLTETNQSDIDYMNSLPFSLSIPTHGCIVTHAGLVPGIALQDQNLYDLIEASKHLQYGPTAPCTSSTIPYLKEECIRASEALQIRARLTGNVSGSRHSAKLCIDGADEACGSGRPGLCSRFTCSYTQGVESHP